MNEIDELILRALHERPTMRRSQIVRKIGASHPRKVDAALERLISDGKLLPQGFWSPAKVGVSAIQGVALIRVVDDSQRRALVKSLLDQFHDIGTWKFASTSRGGQDYAFFLSVPNSHQRFSIFIDQLMSIDGVSSDTTWFIPHPP